jgi:membrane associated rhomboid family serine protease
MDSMAEFLNSAAGLMSLVILVGITASAVHCVRALQRRFWAPYMIAWIFFGSFGGVAVYYHAGAKAAIFAVLGLLFILPIAAIEQAGRRATEPTNKLS